MGLILVVMIALALLGVISFAAVGKVIGAILIIGVVLAIIGSILGSMI
jgi:hypothetical protein